MLKNKYVWLFAILAIILTVCSVMAFSSGGEAVEQDSRSYTSFKAYYPGNSLFDSVINKTVPPTDIIKGGSLEIMPRVEESTGALIGAYTSNGVEVNAKNLEILFDKVYLIQHLNENLKSDIDSYWIVNISAFIDGYILVIKYGDTLSFMPVLSGHELYGGFADKTIYSCDEFAKLCEPKDCTFIVNDITVECDQHPIMHYGMVKFPLRSLFENLGFDVDWDGATESVIFSKGDDTYSYGTNKSKNPTGNIIKNGIAVRGFSCQIVNGRTMIQDSFNTLGTDFGITILADSDAHVVTVTSQ